MDPTFDNLPYQIPGPAGGPSFATPSQELVAPSPKSESARRFRLPPWQLLLRRISAPPYGTDSLSSSVAVLRANALANRFIRLHRLPVLLGAFSWVGRDASVTLLDPSGAICATIHAAVFERYRKGIEPGSALLLRGVAALAYVERRPSGFRVHEDEGLHVSLQPCHVEAVIPVASDFPIASTCHNAPPKESYLPAALSPPVLRRPPTRRGPLPVDRAPFRPRVEPQNVQQYHRPVPGRGQSAYRGGARGRYDQQRQTSSGALHRPPATNSTMKRPYTSYAGPTQVPLNRRPGMQPPPKRLTPDRNHSENYPMQRGPEISSIQNGTTGSVRSLASAPSNGLSSLTEDQLDCLFGDIDVDAMIAASGKSQTMGIISTVESGNNKFSPPFGSIATIEQQRDDAIHRSSTLKLDPVRDGGVPEPSEEMAAESGNGKDGKQPLSTVDHAMLDNLLEGLDDTDFG